ncbi:MAG: tetratricopeptide repeat protein [Candidatus Thermoplasmatota archaeon]
MHQETDGNPFFIEELLRALVLDGIIYRKNAVWEAKDLTKVAIPTTVKDTIIRRVSALDPECQEVLKYAAVIGQIFQFHTLAKTTGKDRKELAILLEKIEKQGIIHSEKNIIRFDHAKLQDVIYSDVPDYRRSIMHEEIAKAIEELNKENLASVAVELAHHYQQAGIVDKTAKYALLAAEVAEKKFTPTEAAQHYMTTLQALERMKITLENKEKQLKIADKIAYMYYISGDWDMSINYVYLVGKLAKETKNQAMLGESYRNTGMIQIGKAEYDRAIGNLQNALRIAEEINDVHEMSEAYYWMGKICWFTGKLDDAMKHLKNCLGIARETGDTSMTAKAVMDIGMVHNLRGEYKESLEYMMRSLGISEKLDDKYEIARAYNNIGVTYGETGDYVRAVEWCEKCINICRKIGYLRVVGYGLNNAAKEYAKLGQQLDKAKEYLDEALNIFTRLGEKRAFGYCHLNYGIIYHKKNEWDKSIECFEKTIKIAGEIEDLDLLSQTYSFYGKMFADKGDKEKAKEKFEKSIEFYEKLSNKQKVEELKKELEKL